MATLERTPKNATHWSRASMSAESGLSESTVGRIWKAFNLKPHQVDTFKLFDAGADPSTPVKASENGGAAADGDGKQDAITPLRITQDYVDRLERNCEAPYWHSFTYNPVGNRLSETRHAAGGDTVRNYTYPAAGGDRPHTVSGISETGPGGPTSYSYSYDSAGNTTARNQPTGNQALTWDNDGRLASITQAGQTTGFLYDAEGSRLLRREPTNTTLYLDGMELRLDHGTQTVTGTGLYRFGEHTVAVRTGGASSTVQFLAADHHGTAGIAITGTTAALTQRRHTPFGTSRGTQPGSWPGQHSFVNGVNDPTTGLLHLGARDYDPAIGRFISVDPIMDVTDSQQIHGYGYSNANPTSFSDPTGLRLIADDGGGGGGGGGGSASSGSSRVGQPKCTGTPDRCADKAGLNDYKPYRCPRQKSCGNSGPGGGPRSSGPTPNPTPGPSPVPPPPGSGKVNLPWWVRGLSDLVGEGGHRAGTYGLYAWDTGVRRIQNPPQTLWDAVTGTTVIEDLSAAEAILGEGGELYRAGPYCRAEMSCITGVSTPPDADAFTTGHTVRFRAGAAPGEALIAHETQHVYDIEAVGGKGFYGSYVADYLTRRGLGASDGQAYRNNYWERRAYDVGDNYNSGARPHWDFMGGLWPF